MYKRTVHTIDVVFIKMQVFKGSNICMYVFVIKFVCHKLIKILSSVIIQKY